MGHRHRHKKERAKIHASLHLAAADVRWKNINNETSLRDDERVFVLDDLDGIADNERARCEQLFKLSFSIAFLETHHGPSYTVPL